MRQVLNLNKKWAFTKRFEEIPTQVPCDWDFVRLPHTWNAIDGQDGGSDYYRGTCCYVTEIDREELPEADRYYLEINGANSSADVYVNGKKLAHHDGGYSAWRVDITDEVDLMTVVAVTVDNSVNETVYPQMADFTFYGGLYRDVNLIAVNSAHFDLEDCGGPGIRVTPTVHVERERNASVEIQTFPVNARGRQIRYVLKAADGAVVGETTVDAGDAAVTVTLPIRNAHLWNGREDPYLYTAEAFLMQDGEILDNVSARFGVRAFEIDPEEGFFLNGRQYPLRGVSRHQDRWGCGNALLPSHHREDMDLICELGANSVRLAHYQQDQYFYDLCDERGIVVWAEIPYITSHMPGGRDNTVSQLKELIIQNYNHPSIAVWGLSNEITMKGESADLVENHVILNSLAHQLDPTRKTTVAAVTSSDIHGPYLQISDVVAYNHYFGWYGGEVDMYGPWLDRFHEECPNRAIGMSEYGCEGLNWHTSDPVQGDYTEEYQAHYHEEVIRQLFTRKYLWATYVWNMFDFGADNRNEGGEAGQNHKGLVTFDRKYKKDAFYAYKAWLSSDPFVHICGKRYVDRVEDVTKVTVYSNQPEVELFVNGRSLGRKKSPEHFFCFDVPNVGQSTLRAVAGACSDESSINRVEKFNDAYRMTEKGVVLNWVDVREIEGYLSLHSRVKDVLETQEGRTLLEGLLSGADKDRMMLQTEDLLRLVGSSTVLRCTRLLGSAGIELTKEQLLELNERLCRIRQP